MKAYRLHLSKSQAFEPRGALTLPAWPAWELHPPPPTSSGSSVDPLGSPLVSAPSRAGPSLPAGSQQKPASLSWHTWPGEKVTKPGASSSLGCKQQGSGKLAAAFSALSPAPSLEPHPGDRGCPNLLEKFPSHTCTHAGCVGESQTRSPDWLCILDPPTHVGLCWGGPHFPTDLEALGY